MLRAEYSKGINMIEIEIDGKKIKTDEGASIIEAADDAGIHIPRYCYHKKLSVAANCRMCLIEVDNVGKPLPACATPVSPDMKVFTKSKKAMDAQRSVMEYLLINHPLDCPICDQGGECELQDLAVGYGSDHSNYDQPKRAVFSEDIGPLVETEMTRCIHCTRCVRFGDEIAGMRELGVVNRGEDSEIGTYVKHMMQSELSGNVIDLCPVGALTAKPSKYTNRSWEMFEHPMVAPHDCVGSNIFVHSKGREYAKQRLVMRAVPRENPDINETWISDRDRFSYEGVMHKDRCYDPMMKKGNDWVKATWQQVLDQIIHRLSAIDPAQTAALASPNSTTEEFYLLQKLMRAMGSHNIDYRIHEQDFSDQNEVAAFPNIGVKIAEIEELSAILLVGSNIRYEQPMLSHRIKKAALNDADIFAVNPSDYTFTFPLSGKMITADIVDALAQIAKALADTAGEKQDALAQITPSDSAKLIAEKLKASERAGIFLGEFVMTHPNAAHIRALAHMIGKLSQTSVGYLSHGANAAGACLAGAIPHRGSAASTIDRIGLDAKALLTSDPVQAYFLLGLEPEFDAAYPAAAMQNLKAADMVVCLTPYVTETMKTYADFILPISPFTQTSGTFVNGEGTWQSFDAIAVPEGESKPAWKVLRAIARKLSLTGFNYKSTSDIRDKLKQKVDAMTSQAEKEPVITSLPSAASELLRLAPIPMYRSDGLVRRASALQETLLEGVACITVNAALAEQLNLKVGMSVTAVQGDSRVTLPVMIDHNLADGLVLIPAGLEETAAFGQVMAPVRIEREAL